MPTNPYIGREFGAYRMESRIGQGGMGAVYRAVHTTLRQERALKILKESLVGEDPSFIERFLREARAAAAIDHTNVVRVYDAGEVGGTYFIAQELVDGVPLSAILKNRGAIPEEEAATIILQAARGLQAAQELGVIHRDVKPANLLITRKGVVKVADFGLAKVLAEDAQITMSGQALGTPAYMCPEQAAAEPMDARGDIYSLGVTLFEMVTGERPYSGPTPVSVLRKHCDDPVPDPRQKRASVDAAFSPVIMKMMAKKPEERFQTYEEFSKELKGFLAEKTPAQDSQKSLTV
ncbi:MAG: serine/threonine-protein kinase, partial [Planctomycetota bacterium]